MDTGNFFLDSLPVAVSQRLAFQLETVRLTKGQHLYLQGQTVDYVYFPISAVVSKYQSSEDGRAIEVALTGRDGAVGLASALDLGEAMQSCQVSIGGSAMKIRTEFVIKIVEHEAQLTSAVVRFLNSRLRQMSRRVLCNRYHSVEQRLCTWMLMVSERCGRSSIRITHNDAARALGVHRPTITDAMAILCGQGIIEQSTGRIDMIDESKIRKISCECAADLSMRAVGAELGTIEISTL